MSQGDPTRAPASLGQFLPGPLQQPATLQKPADQVQLQVDATAAVSSSTPSGGDEEDASVGMECNTRQQAESLPAQQAAQQVGPCNNTLHWPW